MTIALVGSAGAVASGTTSVAPAFGQATTAGNFLVLWVMSDGGAPSTPSGWTMVPGHIIQDLIYYKANCGASETAPTVTDNGTTMRAVLAEFSGVALSSPLDQTAVNNVTTSPQTATAANADVASGELVIVISFTNYTMAATKTTSHSLNNGTIAGNFNNDATSIANHYRFTYAITTANASADALTHTFTTTNIALQRTQVASFKLLATKSDIPPDPQASHRRMHLLRR